MNSKKIMIGHKKQIDFIDNAITKKKLSNSLLIKGSYGIGKSLFANIIAEKTISSDGNFIDNTDKNIIKITAKEDNKSGDITIDQIRNINREFHHTSANTRHRVIIIDAIDDLNINASNALLKMLEEPPEKVIFILINHSSVNTINTIASRCLKINLYDLTKEQSLEVLKNNITDLSDDELNKLNYISENSPGRAIDLYSNHGFEIYDLISQIFLNQNSTELTKLISLISGVTQKKLWHIFEFTIVNILIRIYKSSYHTNNSYLKYSEPIILEHFIKHNKLNNLYKYIQEVTTDLKLASALNLDKKSCLVKIFNSH